MKLTRYKYNIGAVLLFYDELLQFLFGFQHEDLGLGVIGVLFCGLGCENDEGVLCGV